MAPNGTVGRKAPTPTPNAPEKNVSLENLFDDLENNATEVKIEAKKRMPQVKIPGSYLSEVTGVPKSKDPNAKTVPPPINRVPSPITKAFPNGKPMADKPDVLKCNHCKRAVSKHAMVKHVESCLNKKQEKQRKKKEAKDARDAAARKEKAGESEEEEEDGAKKTATKTGGLTASKKRKAADEGEEGAPTKKKKKKDEPKAKAPRPKAPVDVEKQCGVELPQGGQCARSLTCKSHSMGAKRGVPGRSAPYDKLLLEYQRKNQAKLQKAAFDANAPNPEDDNLPTGPVDSEEEKDTIMSTIARNWGGRPIYQPVHAPLRKKYELNRMKGIMQSTFTGRSGGSIFGAGSGTGFFGSLSSAAPQAPTVDNDGMVHARRGSVVPGARSMMAPSRKPSIPSGA